MYDEKTQRVIDSRQKCPVCGGEVRLHNVVKGRTLLRTGPIIPTEDEVKEWRFEIRCPSCHTVWPIKKAKPRTQPGTGKMDFTSVRNAIREWNGISRMEKKERRDNEVSG